MKANKNLFFILISMFAFSSCKKEAIENADSSLTTYNFSSSIGTITPDQNFLLFGISTLAKIDTEGNLLWKISDYEADYTLALTNNENIGCYGFEKNYHFDDNFLTVNKYNNQGNLGSSKKLYMSDASFITNPKIVELSSGDLIFMGTTGRIGLYNLNPKDSLILVIKTDKNLNTKWTKKIKMGSDFSYINKIKEVSADGNVFLVGKSRSAYGVNYAMVDSSGTLLWEKHVNIGIYENYASDIHKINSNEFVITGYCDKGTTIVDYDYQFFALKVDHSGNYIGEYVSGGPKQDFCNSSVYDPKTNILTMIGMEGRASTNDNLKFSSVKIIKVNISSGTLVSDQSYAKLQSCGALNAILNGDGSLSIIGRKNAFENEYYQNTFFMKIKSDGSF